MSEDNVRGHNVGSSDYSKHKIQVWDIWIEYRLNPWDADIIKRVLRKKKAPIPGDWTTRRSSMYVRRESGRSMRGLILNELSVGGSKNKYLSTIFYSKSNTYKG